MPQPTAPVRPPAGVGPLLRDWRTRRRRSQMDLALDVGVSTRHLSWIETGRARPSPAVILALADGLEIPLRERNRLLLAAGYAPRYAESPLDDQALAAVRQALQRLLAAHEPYPALVLDRQWNVVLANGPALALAALLPQALQGPPLNVFRASLHPQGFASLTENFDDWGAYLLAALDRAVLVTADAQLAALRMEVLAYPGVQALRERGRDRSQEGRPEAHAGAAAPLLVPCVLRLPQGRVSMFTTLTTFGTPGDITLQELCVEMFYPADAGSEALLRAASA